MTAKLMLGSVLVGKGACSQAISLYERILGEAQRQPSIYYNLGTCYLREKRPADALREAELYIKAKPQDAKGHVLTCDALYEQRNYPRALAECQQAERLDQVDGTIKGKVGRIYLGMKNYSSAVTYLEQAVAGQKATGTEGSGDARRARRGVRGGARAARTSSTRSAMTSRRSAKDPRALATAGQVYFLAGNDERAMAALKESLALEPIERAGARPGWSRCSTGAPASPSRRTRSAPPTTFCPRRSS